MGETIKRLRERDNLTQIELADLIGVNPVTLSRYETGDRKPKIDKLEKMAEVFGVTVNYLRGDEDNKNTVTITTEEYRRLKSYERTVMNIIKEHEKG